MTTAIVFQLTATVLETPERWTRGAIARNKNGVSTSTRKEQTCWCLLGALEYACELAREKGVYASYSENLGVLKSTLRKHTRGFEHDVGRWNDNPENTYEDVRAVLLEAERG